MTAPETVFDPAVRAALLARIERLRPDSRRHWGKMTPAQMLAHCTAALAEACGEGATRQSLIGRLIGRIALKRALGERPMPRNAPTDRTYRMTDDRDFTVERERLTAIINRFAAGGQAAADGQLHVFFGRLTGDEWGRLMYKHLDHHLRQFGS
jgi:hypothetical protein